MREAADFQLSGSAAKPRQRVEDYEELQEYQGRKRQEFEETIRRTRWNIQAWAKYANWEASQGEFARCARPLASLFRVLRLTQRQGKERV